MLSFSENIICASLFTGVYDVNINEMLQADDFQIVEKWVQSIRELGLNGFMFHNNFSQKTVSEHEYEQLRFCKVEFNSSLNANVYRYLVYFDFLKMHKNHIRNTFFTDIADVEVVKNPFADPLFIENSGNLFCGDEDEILDNPWMQDHCTHLRNQIDGFADFESKNKSETLFNCGVIGGQTKVMLELLDQLVQIHSTHTVTNQTPFTLDMGAFNYVARTYFADRLFHGFPVNTRFKGYESEREDYWFRHK
ncbi:hypothetical protein [Algoriphagus boritolerans]|uniref:Uncharacterized protein n=1 Tax=Algoriphagus boritolerans DSM 17298 = JCM 18970 TaxID=1120964 RepID=A0A1H5UU85_9BACT|nr:hypothetical protein [Algoriphagus boritolerans]SEF78556.1 hypothetical protein SAMN03080598_01396 [Algoriphagus boritolerans DSM 17298 = JCM 18970]